jgi:hypothetical protein
MCTRGGDSGGGGRQNARNDGMLDRTAQRTVHCAQETVSLGARARQRAAPRPPRRSYGLTTRVLDDRRAQFGARLPQQIHRPGRIPPRRDLRGGPVPPKQSAGGHRPAPAVWPSSRAFTGRPRPWWPPGLPGEPGRNSRRDLELEQHQRPVGEPGAGREASQELMGARSQTGHTAGPKPLGWAGAGAQPGREQAQPTRAGAERYGRAHVGSATGGIMAPVRSAFQSPAEPCRCSKLDPGAAAMLRSPQIGESKIAVLDSSGFRRSHPDMIGPTPGGRAAVTAGRGVAAR